MGTTLHAYHIYVSTLSCGALAAAVTLRGKVSRLASLTELDVRWSSSILLFAVGLSAAVALNRYVTLTADIESRVPTWASDCHGVTWTLACKRNQGILLLIWILQGSVLCMYHVVSNLGQWLKIASTMCIYERSR